MPEQMSGLQSVSFATVSSLAIEVVAYGDEAMHYSVSQAPLDCQMGPHSRHTSTYSKCIWSVPNRLGLLMSQYLQVVVAVVVVVVVAA
jgi:hypothetical protein